MDQPLIPPRRRFLPCDATLRLDTDAHGFITEAVIARSMGILDLIQASAVLVVAPPWLGKSFVLRQLWKYLRRVEEIASGETAFGPRVWFTSFEQAGFTRPPDWWTGWRGSADRACWIVDALDEDARRDARAMHSLLDVVQELNREERRRLCLFMSCRESEQPEDICERLEDLFDDVPLHSLFRMRLLPMDAESARDHVGSNEAFERVCEQLTRNDLQALAGLPATLNVLKNLKEDEDATVAGVWRRVLMSHLTDRRDSRRLGRCDHDLDARFEAVCRIAAVLTFGPSDELVDGGAHVPGTTVEDAFPRRAPSGEHLRAAAREGLLSSIFARTDVGHRFAQDHVRQWCSAFALQHASLIQVRPLTTDKRAEPVERHAAVLALLGRITTDGQVKTWIDRTCGALPAQLDAAPLNIAAARNVLDRLQELARESSYGLFLWRNEKLAYLDVFGVGDELRGRLLAPGVSDNELVLLLEVAAAIRAEACVADALNLVVDDDRPRDVRWFALSLIEAAGSPEDRVTLGSRAPAIADDRIKSDVVEMLYRHRLWSYEEAIREAPTGRYLPGESSSTLDYVLENDLDDARARWILDEYDPTELAGPERPARQHGRRRRGRERVLLAAIQRIAAKEDITDEDYGRLEPVLCLEDRIDWGHEGAPGLQRVFLKNVAARRRVFAELLEADPTEGSSRAWWILCGEDVTWLSERLESRAEPPEWLWRLLLNLAYRPDCSQAERNRLRRSMRERRSEVLRRFDRERRRFRDAEKRAERRRTREQQQRESEQLQLHDCVEGALSHRTSSLHEQMGYLSWLCFVEEAFRPTNVIGTWDDLDARTRCDVLERCADALMDAKPTRIPTTDSFPSRITYEAAAFSRVALEHDTFELTGPLIRRWLPTALFAMTSINEQLVALCRSRDVTATEDAIMQEMRRELRMTRPFVTLALNLPHEFWTRRLSEGVAGLVRDSRLNPRGRASVLRVLSHVAPALAAAIGTSWVRPRDRDADVQEIKRNAGLDALLVTTPEHALDVLEERYEDEGRSVLLELEVLRQGRRGVSTQLQEGSGVQLGRLTGILLREFPPEDDPPLEVGVARSVQIEDELMRLRDGLVRLLIERGQPDDETALERLSVDQPTVAARVEAARASETAASVLDRLAIHRRERHADAVPTDDVIRLLKDAEGRVVRSDVDLQDVLIEELAVVEADAENHLTLLYRPPEEKGGARKVLREEALRDYIYCRLKDRLRMRVRTIDVVLFTRENLAPKNRRTDVEVIARSVSGDMVRVVIELKWSDNRELATSLPDQLGERYLKGQGIGRGIYLVGWMGTPRWKGGIARPRTRWTPDNLRATLENQAAEFRSNNPGFDIRVVVMGLEW